MKHYKNDLEFLWVYQGKKRLKIYFGLYKVKVDKYILIQVINA